MDRSPELEGKLTQKDFERLSGFRYQLQCFLRHSTDLCQARGLTALQYLLLLHIKGMPERDWATVGELAERLQAKHHGTVALIDRCVEAGLVERRAHELDRRYIQIHLLEEGTRLVEEIAELHQPELQHLRDELPVPIPGLGS